MLHRNNLEIVIPQGNPDELPGKFTTSFNQYIHARPLSSWFGCRENDVFYSTSQNKFFFSYSEKVSCSWKSPCFMFYFRHLESLSSQCKNMKGKGRKYFFPGKVWIPNEVAFLRTRALRKFKDFDCHQIACRFVPVQFYLLYHS